MGYCIIGRKEWVSRMEDVGWVWRGTIKGLYGRCREDLRRSVQNGGESVRMEEISKRKKEGKFRKNKRIASLI